MNHHVLFHNNSIKTLARLLFGTVGSRVEDVEDVEDDDVDVKL